MGRPTKNQNSNHKGRKPVKPVLIDTQSQLEGDLSNHLPAEKEITSDELLRINQRLQLQLNQARAQLDMFGHTLTHQVQEPLRKIITFSNLLVEIKTKNGRVNLLKKLGDSSARVRELVKDLIDFASVTNYEKLQVKVDLNNLLETTMFDLELLIDEKKAQVKTRGLPTIEAVPFQIGQLFYNIIHNSLKFSNPGIDPVIEISSKKVTANNLKIHTDLDANLRFYEIRFSDNGIGFEQKYSSQIFTMFQRLGSGSENAGTGMGLTISKKIVDNHHGKIYAEGALNEGTIITVILPAEQPPKALADDSTIQKTWL